MNNQKLFDLIVEKYNDLAPQGYLKSFVNDLYIHDKNDLALAEPNDEFFWAIRDSGTFILTKTSFKRPNRSIAWINSCKSAMESFFNGSDPHKVFYYNGKFMGEIVNVEVAMSVFREWKAS